MHLDITLSTTKDFIYGLTFLYLIHVPNHNSSPKKHYPFFSKESSNSDLKLVNHLVRIYNKNKPAEAK